MLKRDIKLFVYACMGGFGFTFMYIFAVGIVDAPMICIPLFILSVVMFFVGAIKHNACKRMYLNDKPLYDTLPRMYQGNALNR